MTDLRPSLAFRIGVTGHRERVDAAGRRELLDERDPRLIAAVDACLAFVRDQLARLAADPQAQRAYAPPAPGEPPFEFRLVCALAEGADRLVAGRAEPAGARLYAPLPFPHDAYVADFPDTAAAFDRLLVGQDRFELDGDHRGGEAQTESYEAVGRFTVRNCDLLIAIWDGKPARGQGGAESTAEYAARTGVRVWWIHALEDRKPKLIRSLAEFRNPERAPEGDEAFAALRAYLRETILPPQAERPEREGALGQLGAALSAFVRPDQGPLDEFYADTPRPRSAIWRSYAAFMAILAPDPGGYVPGEPDRPGLWTDLYLAADRLSADYGDRYRSSYVLVALLVIVALASAAFGGEESPSWQWLFIVAEILALLGISALVVVNYAWRWHERWISYRLLAELARKQRVLSLIGQSLPGADVAQLAADAPNDKGAPRDAWIAWLFMAHRRATPLPTGAMDTQRKRTALEEGLAMLNEQIKYHEGRRRRARSADKGVRRISESFFLATIVLAFAKFGLIRGEDYENNAKEIYDIVFYTAAVSSVATAFVGIRAYAEFALLARQSRHMLAALKTARDELTALQDGPIEAPQGSAHLGRALYAATTAMMQDITGWAHLFRVKTLEAG